VGAPGVHRESVVSLGDERAALERAEQRFVNLAELTGQLQESVPARYRLAWFLEHVFVGTGASTLRLALRYALLILCFPGAFLLIAYFVQGRMAEWPIVVAFAVLAFVSVLLVNTMRDALFGPAGRSWRKAALVSIASWFLIPGFTFALCLTFSGDVRSSLMDALLLFPAALITPLAMIIPVCVFAVDARSQQEWANLSIN
jgi:hypothetical protein